MCSQQPFCSATQDRRRLTHPKAKSDSNPRELARAGQRKNDTTDRCDGKPGDKGHQPLLWKHTTVADDHTRCDGIRDVAARKAGNDKTNNCCNLHQPNLNRGKEVRGSKEQAREGETNTEK